MTTHPRTLVLPLTLLVIAGSVLTGCSATGAASTGHSGSSAGTSASAPASTTASVTTGEGLCALVSVDQANAAVKPSTPFTEQAPGSFVHGEPECGFTTADRSIIINVTVFDTATTPFPLTSGVVGDDQLTPVSGIGDRAAVGQFELDAVIGSRGLVVENFTDGAVSPDQLVALARLFAAQIH